MSNEKTIIDTKLVDIEEWNDLINGPGFHKLEEFIQERKNTHMIVIRRLAKEESLDNSIKITARLNRIDELQCLLNRKEAKIKEKKKLNMEGKL